MGVLPNQKRVFFSDSDSHDELLVHSESDGEQQQDPNEVPQPRRAPKPLLSPATNRKFCGHKLTLKKGRRSRHRYENERMLFSNVGMDSEEPPEGWDIANEARSHFRKLLDGNNKSLLERFVAMSEEDPANTNNNNNTPPKRGGEIKDPEEAYLTIHSNVRAAMKKHLPMGMLEGLDTGICEFFTTNPEAQYISQDLSSYERLLAHACSMYYQLRSQSFDIDGVRTLKIDNPGSTFSPMDPSLTEYLKIRNRLS